MSNSLDPSSVDDIQEQDDHTAKSSAEEALKPSLVTRLRSMSWRKKIIFYTTVILCGFYAVSLVVINSSWFKSKITNKLELKSAIQWQVGSIYWLPFGSIYINEVESFSEEFDDPGGISISSIRVSPCWKSVFAGELIWNDLLLDGAIIDVEKQWLENLLKQSDQELAPSVNQNPEPKIAQHLIKKDALVKKEAHKTKSASSAGSVESSKLAIVEKKQPELEVGPDCTFRLENSQVKVRSGNKVYLNMREISMKVPFSGVEQTGELSFLRTNGERLQLPIEWDKRQIKIEDRSMEWLGIKCKLALVAQPIGGSMPFIFEFGIADQPLSHKLDEPNFKVSIHASSLKGHFKLRGNLLSPQTWSGLGGVAMNEFAISETQKTNKSLHFDRVYAVARLQQGGLIIEDAQAQSEEINFMANGTIFKNAYAFGILRCVANEDYMNKLNGIYNGSRALLVERGSDNVFENLNTPDRSFFDLRFDGKLTNLEMKHNRSDQWQGVREALQRLKQFKDTELKEDGLFLPES